MRARLAGQSGTYSVTFRVSDRTLTSSQAVSIVVAQPNVNRPPVLAALGNKTVEVTKPLSFVLSATDPDGESLTYSADGLPSGAALTGPTFAWTPVSSRAGTYPVTFAVSVDRYGEPYVVWTDYRRKTTEVYSAATTVMDPNPLDSKTVVAAAGAVIGTDPAALNGPEDVSVVVPAGACQANLRMAIWRIVNPQVPVSLGS
jgi:hypothetical protein